MAYASEDVARRCRWAAPTLFLDAPYWMAAESFPWSCTRNAAPRPLPTTEECATCGRFEPVRPQQCAGTSERPDFFR
jgi:hypothetical protein